MQDLFFPRPPGRAELVNDSAIGGAFSSATVLCSPVQVAFGIGGQCTRSRMRSIGPTFEGVQHGFSPPILTGRELINYSASVSLKAMLSAAVIGRAEKISFGIHDQS